MEILDTAEAEYCTLYWKNKWSKKSQNLDSNFVGNYDESDGAEVVAGIIEVEVVNVAEAVVATMMTAIKKRCHNCGKIGHLVITCQTPGGGEERTSTNDTNEEIFPGVNGTAIRDPHHAGEPRERTLADGTTVKQCRLYRSWGDHYRAEHPTNISDEGDRGI